MASKGSQERRNAMVEYLRQMSDIITESKPGSEEAIQALSAIITEIRGKEALIATDQRLSKVLEKLILSSSGSGLVLKPLLTQLQGAVLDVVYDQYGSHVFETLLKAITGIDMDFEFSQTLNQFTESICSDMSTLIADGRATFVIRCAMMVFSGCGSAITGQGEALEELKSFEIEDKDSNFTPYFLQMLEAVGSMSSDSITALSQKPHSSLTLQYVLILASKFGRAENLLSRIFLENGEKFATLRITRFLSSSVQSKLLEVAAFVMNDSGSPLALRFLEELLSPAATDLSSTETLSILESQFSFSFLQAFASSVKDGDLATELVVRLTSVGGLKTLASRGKKHGLVLIQKIAETLVTVIRPQKLFFDNLTAALGLTKDNVWAAILGLTPESFETSCDWTTLDESWFTPQGCLLMSTLCQFKISSVQMIVSSSNTLENHLKHIDFRSSRFVNDIGPGRMLQTIISSASCFPSSLRGKFTRNFILGGGADLERLGQLVRDRKVGAWLVTAAWDSCDVQTKKQLGDALLSIQGLKEINSKVWTHCGLATYSSKNEEWIQAETRKTKAQNLLSEIVGENVGAKAAKKHKQ